MTSHHPIDGPSCSRCNGPQDHRSINRRLWCDQCVRQAGPAISAFQRAFHAKDKELAGIITTYISDLVSIRFVDDGVSHARRRLLKGFPARRGARFADEGRRWHNQERAIMKLTTVALASVLALSSTFAFAQGGGGGAGGGSAGGSSAGTDGGSSTAGGTAGSSTTTGSSMDGSTTGGAGANPNNTVSPSGNTLGPNPSPSGSTVTPTGPGSGTRR